MLFLLMGLPKILFFLESGGYHRPMMLASFFANGLPNAMQNYNIFFITASV